MSKIIDIDENLFRIPSKSGSRKKRETNNNNKIKIKSTISEKPKSLKRNHILKFIREQQEQNHKKMLNNDPNIRHDSDDYKENFNTSFGDTLGYLMNLVEDDKRQTKNTFPSQQSTLKNRPVHENVSMNIPSSLQDISHSLSHEQSSPITLSEPVKTNSPSWGCMKNGNLPTFRSWKNQTQKIPLNINSNQFEHSTNYEQREELNDLNKPSFFQNKQHDRIQQLKQGELNKNIPQLHYPKQKRTVRRTYKVGKSKNKPQVGILISNRTIRNRVSTENQLLKQTPIEDVRRYLIKKGFIKVGSSCPNDVLRKMHETAKLMCGEMENHNPDNLLYNYFNDVENI